LSAALAQASDPTPHVLAEVAEALEEAAAAERKAEAEKGDQAEQGGAKGAPAQTSLSLCHLSPPSLQSAMALMK
jgi:hypothetical protein